MATEATPKTETAPRFTLTTMMTGTLVICVLLALLAAAPVAITILTCNLLVFMSGPASVGGIVYFRGYARAFCVGTALVAGWFIIGALFKDSVAQAFVSDLADFPNERSDVLELLLVYVFIASLSGVTVVAMRAIARLSQEAKA